MTEHYVCSVYVAGIPSRLQVQTRISIYIQRKLVLIRKWGDQLWTLCQPRRVTAAMLHLNVFSILALVSSSGFEEAQKCRLSFLDVFQGSRSDHRAPSFTIA